MSDYCGSEAQIALQRRIRDRAGAFRTTPSLVNAGRLTIVTDPDVMGWSVVRDLALTDGIVGIGPGSHARFLPGLTSTFPDGWNTPSWDYWSASWPTVEAAIAPILAAPLPDGWTVEATTHPDAATIAEAQALGESCGVAPMPGYYLAGHEVAGVLVMIRDPGGRAIATAHGDMRYHPQGAMAGTLWAGLVAVDPDARRGGLGRRANAEALRAAHAAIGWHRVVEFAKTSNTASSRMIRSCGLETHEDWCVIAIMPSGAEFTR